jgi:hypothetical protein
MLGDCETSQRRASRVSEGQAGGDEESEEGLAEHVHAGNTRIRLTIYAPGSSFTLSLFSPSETQGPSPPHQLCDTPPPSVLRLVSPAGISDQLSSYSTLLSMETWGLETDPTSHHPFALAPPLFLAVGAVYPRSNLSHVPSCIWVVPYSRYGAFQEADLVAVLPPISFFGHCILDVSGVLVVVLPPVVGAGCCTLRSGPLHFRLIHAGISRLSFASPRVCGQRPTRPMRGQAITSGVA